MTKDIRIGVLGAARITPPALLTPARKTDGVAVTAIAARDRARAEKFAAKHGIAKVHDSYEDLLADPDIDAIYNPLPNSHHAVWTIRALKAGKHVLCEKPLASNADEARAMKAAADETGKILAEAFHWRYHPLRLRIDEIVASGEIGAVQHVEAHFCVPLLEPKNIRWRLDLAGGAAMDTGCYTVNMVRHFAGGEPEVESAAAKLWSDGVDRQMQAKLTFPGGVTGRICCSMAGWPLLRAKLWIKGDGGEIEVFNPLAPQIYHSLKVAGRKGRRREKVNGQESYTHQLMAFRDWLNGGTPMISDAEDGIRNMQVLDAIYRAAGMEPRQGPDLGPNLDRPLGSGLG